MYKIKFHQIKDFAINSCFQITSITEKMTSAFLMFQVGFNFPICYCMKMSILCVSSMDCIHMSEFGWNDQRFGLSKHSIRALNPVWMEIPNELCTGCTEQDLLQHSGRSSQSTRENRLDATTSTRVLTSPTHTGTSLWPHTTTTWL